MIGMRERVVALSGKFAAGPLPNGGFGLQVEFPTLQRRSLMAMGIRVLLVDDHAVVREGYRRLIEKHQDIDVVAEAENAASGYQAFKTCKPGCRRHRYLDARARRHRSRPAHPPMGRRRSHSHFHDARQRDIRTAGLSCRRARLCHKAVRPRFWSVRSAMSCVGGPRFAPRSIKPSPRAGCAMTYRPWTSYRHGNSKSCA